MTIAILIYTISLLEKINEYSSCIRAFSGAGVITCTIVYGLTFLENNTDNFRIIYVKPALIKCLWFFCVSIIVTVIIPSEKTSYMMVGGYLAETVSKSDQFNKALSDSGNLAGKLTTIVNNKLDLYIKDTEKELSKGIDTKIDKGTTDGK